MTFTFFKMTRFDLDPIWPDRASKSYSEGCGFDCIVLIINLIVAGRTILVPSFNAIKTHGNAFALPKLFALFMRILAKYIKKFLVLPPFILPFTPLIFTFWRGEKCHRNHFFLLLRAFFSFFLWKKTILPFLSFLLG